MFPAHARVRPFVLIIAAVLTGGLLLLLHEPGATSYAARSPLPTITPVCLPLLGGGLSLTDVGYVHNGDGSATLGLGLQNQDVVDLTRISFSASGWTPLAPAHDAVMAGLLGDHLISWYAPGGRLDFTPLFSGYSLGASERFSFTVQGFIPAQAIQLTVRKGEDVLETHTIDLNAPACDRMPLPVSPLPIPNPDLTLPPSVPNVSVYLFDEENYTIPVSEAEQQQRWDDGQPVPGIAVAANEIVAHTRSKPGLFAPTTSHLRQASGSSWTVIYEETFDNSFPTKGANGECQLELLSISTSSGYLWGGDDFRTHNNSADAAWPYAGGDAGENLQPGSDTYPENVTTQLICTFSNFSQAKNILVEFALWLDRADAGDSFFVGFNTGEVNSENRRLFYGWFWGGTLDSANNPEWRLNRLYYPNIGTKVEGNNGKVAVMWQFQSDNNRRAEARGAWLDSITVEKYVQPAANVDCQSLDPTIYVSGVPGSGDVSKGLVLPPDTEDNTWALGLDPALITRVKETNTNWVRVEFIQQPSAFIRLQDRVAISESLDLKHYDRLIDELCANGIATLGLLSYQTIPDRSWMLDGVISDAYLKTYTKTVSLLVDYFDDRIKAWEVWNEPDYVKTRLNAGQFARLVDKVSPIIRDKGDIVVNGGLANVDNLARDYFRGFYVGLQVLGNVGTPFDVFALHPYPSQQYTNTVSGALLIDPQEHWRKESPTVFKKFQDVLKGENALQRNDSDKDIWITEFGWSSAKGSPEDLDDRCVPLEAQWVSEAEQTFYLGSGLDVLFKETAWPNENRPSITKAFWYQYRDTGAKLKVSECAEPLSRWSPSWWVSWFWELIFGPSPEDRVEVPWSFGLYDGNRQPKSSRCTFYYYPEWIAGCYTFNSFVYLPAISREQAVQQ